MTIRAILSIFLYLTLSAAAFAQKVEMVFTFAGSEVGKNIFEARPDGSFESVADLTLAGIKISSRMTGKIADGVPTEYEMTSSQAGTEVRTVVAGGKVKITVKDKTTEHDFKPAKAMFANIHPMFSSSIARAFDPAGGPSQKIDILFLDSGTLMQAEVIQKSPKTIEVAGKKRVVRVYRIRFPTGVDVDIYVNEDGASVAWDVPAQSIKAIAPGYDNLVVDPTTLMPELSQPTLKARVEKGVRIRMRDGVELAADIAFPDAPGQHPAILVRTPYGRSQQMLNAEWWAKRGYVYIAQDCRGRHESGGEWEPFVHERKDGYDTIDWISKQPWSNGAVGMIGGSYVGWVQWWAAVEAHPALKCIVPQVSPPDPFFNIPWDHGIPMLYGAVWWANYIKDRETMKGAPPRLTDFEKFYMLPLSKVDDVVLGVNVPFVDGWWHKETWSAFEGANFMKDLKNVKIPALHVSGWWDGDGIGTKLNWGAMQALGRTNQWLVYGPWSHAFNTTSRLGDVDYGAEAILEMDSLYLRWFDTWLKGKQVGLEKLPRVRVFVTGANEWRSLNNWPDPRSTTKTLYFSAPGPANGPTSMGELAAEPPKQQEPDRYTYNPAGVTIDEDILNQDDPTKANTVLKIEKNENDVLVYKSAPLTEPLEMGGPVEIDLYFSTSAVDTDFFAVVVDIDEKGVMRMIGLPGKIRARYHKSFDRPELLKPGRVYKVSLAHWDVAHQFKAGHRIGVVVSSEMFPMWARNLNTGEPVKDATRMVAAHQTIYHDAKRPSALRFRVLPPKGQ